MARLNLFLFFLLPLCPGWSEESPRPFASGELLHYKIKWGLIPVGRATLEVAPSEEVNGTLCDKFVLTVRTNEFADAFYKIRTRAESYVAPSFSRSLLYKKEHCC